MRKLENSQKLATALVSGLKVTRSSNVALMGSNYLMFKSLKPDPNCARCADTFEIVEPKPVDVFTFEISLIAHELLQKQGVPSTVLIMPADFIRGATSAQLEALRASYTLPRAYTELLERYNVPESGRLFFFESSCRARAQNILRKRILRDRAIEFETEFEDGAQGIYVRPFSHFPLVRVPVGRIVGHEERELPIPLCQMICSAISERLSRNGFSDILWVSNASEAACVNNGMGVAHVLGYLKAAVTLAFFAEKEGGFECISFDRHTRDQLGASWQPLPK